MLKVKIAQSENLEFRDSKSDTHFGVTFQRTLRIPDDGKQYPLPPGLGAFPIKRVLDYQTRVPQEWLKTSGVFIPMYQREAMWISFSARSWRPNAVKVAAGKINAVSGKLWDQTLAARDTRQTGRPSIGKKSGEPLQDYLTCPPQPWLDGFNTGEGTIRQFVAMPLGMGYTVEGQVTGKEEHGGIQIIVYEPRAGRFPDRPPQPAFPSRGRMAPGAGGMAPGSAPMPPMPARSRAPAKKAGTAMGLGAGGTMKQKIYEDPHGIETWDVANFGRVFVHIVNSTMWTEITGEPPPATPVNAKSYTNAGYPWFDVYDEGRADIVAPSVLSAVKSVTQMDAQHGFVGVDDNESVDIDSGQIKATPIDEVPDGDW